MHDVSPVLQQAIAETRVRVIIGYPWWLRPWLVRDVVGITLGRRIYLRAGVERFAPEFLERLLRHELAHARQVARLGLTGFLFRYIGEFVVNLCRRRSAVLAYRAISFEIEARAAEEEDTLV